MLAHSVLGFLPLVKQFERRYLIYNHVHLSSNMTNSVAFPSRGMGGSDSRRIREASVCTSHGFFAFFRHLSVTLFSIPVLPYQWYAYRYETYRTTQGIYRYPGTVRVTFFMKYVLFLEVKRYRSGTRSFQSPTRSVPLEGLLMLVQFCPNNTFLLAEFRRYLCNTHGPF